MAMTLKELLEGVGALGPRAGAPGAAPPGSDARSDEMAEAFGACSGLPVHLGWLSSAYEPFREADRAWPPPSLLGEIHGGGLWLAGGGAAHKLLGTPSADFARVVLIREHGVARCSVFAARGPAARAFARSSALDPLFARWSEGVPAGADGALQAVLSYESDRGLALLATQSMHDGKVGPGIATPEAEGLPSLSEDQEARRLDRDRLVAGEYDDLAVGWAVRRAVQACKLLRALCARTPLELHRFQREVSDKADAEEGAMRTALSRMLGQIGALEREATSAETADGPLQRACKKGITSKDHAIHLDGALIERGTLSVLPGLSGEDPSRSEIWAYLKLLDDRMGREATAGLDVEIARSILEWVTREKPDRRLRKLARAYEAALRGALVLEDGELAGLSGLTVGLPHLSEWLARGPRSVACAKPRGDV